MRQVLCDRLARLRRCLGPAKRGKPTLAAVKRSPTPNESRRFEAELHCPSEPDSQPSTTIRSLLLWTGDSPAIRQRLGTNRFRRSDARPSATAAHAAPPPTSPLPASTASLESTWVVRPISAQAAARTARRRQSKRRNILVCSA